MAWVAAAIDCGCAVHNEAQVLANTHSTLCRHEVACERGIRTENKLVIRWIVGRTDSSQAALKKRLIEGALCKLTEAFKTLKRSVTKGQLPCSLNTRDGL